MQKTTNCRTGPPGGQFHPGAELTDCDVDRMREMHEAYPPGHPDHLGYRRLAKMFDVPRSTVQWICTHRCR